MIDQHQFKSTAIASASYDHETQEMVVTFTTGREYSFDGVPPDLWEEFKKSSSAGTFYNSQIRGVY